jgi:hypothetical protein
MPRSGPIRRGIVALKDRTSKPDAANRRAFMAHVVTFASFVLRERGGFEIFGAREH